MTIISTYILAIGEDGVSREPIEEVTVDVEPDMQGMIIDSMSNRNGNLTELKVCWLVCLYGVNSSFCHNMEF